MNGMRMEWKKGKGMTTYTLSKSMMLFSDPCVLGCMKGSLYWRKGNVKDGTRCSRDGKVKDVCIKDKCRVSSDRIHCYHPMLSLV